MDTLKKVIEINIQFLLLQIKTKKYYKYREVWDKIKNLVE